MKALFHLSALFRTELSEETIKAYLIELQLIDAYILTIPYHGPDPKMNALKVWESMLQKCIRECRFFPTIADFWDRAPKKMQAVC